MDMKRNLNGRILALVLLLALLMTSFSLPALAKTKTVNMLMSKVYTPSSDGDFKKATTKVTGPITLKVGQAICLSPDFAYNGQSAAWLSARAGSAPTEQKYYPSDFRVKIKAIREGSMNISWSQSATDTKTETVRVNVIPADAVDPQSVAFEEGKTITVSVGDEISLHPVLTPANAGSSFRYKSSKPKIAEVTSYYGAVTAKAEGTAKITVTTDNKKTTTITVKVVDKKKPTAVSITNGKTVTITEGETVQLDTAFTPDTAVTTLTWKSSKPKIAKVSSSGLVEGLAKGTAKITVTTKNKKTATITVKVKKDTEGMYERWANPQFDRSYWTNNPTPEQVYKAMLAMKSQYPEGKHFNNNDYYLWQAKGVYYEYVGAGCVAFAFILSDAAFGYLPYREYTDVNAIRVGDILRVDNDSHSVIVLKVTSKNVTVAEGNYNSSVHWNRTITKSKLKKTMNYAFTRYPG